MWELKSGLNERKQPHKTTQNKTKQKPNNSFTKQ